MISIAADVWMAFFRRRPDVAALEALLLEHAVTVHEYVAADLALSLVDARRDVLMDDVRRFVHQKALSHFEVWEFVRHHHLEGSGIGYVDAHALASAANEGLLYWSLDVKVHDIAQRLELAFNPRTRSR